MRVPRFLRLWLAVELAAGVLALGILVAALPLLLLLEVDPRGADLLVLLPSSVTAAALVRRALALPHELATETAPPR
jgi:hypothetical protein